MKTRVAITGAGGFIGARLVERAVARGFDVRGLEVSQRGAVRARALGADVLVGSVEDASLVRALCEDATYVVHTAATVAAGGDLEAFRAVNVGGTRHVLEAARAQGARGVVHLSSVMVYGFSFPRDVDEDGPLRGERNPYCMTKIESDTLALASDDPDGLRVAVLRPGDVYGPGSRPWVEGPLEFLRRGELVLPRAGRGILNHLHVDNLVDAIFLVLEGNAWGHAINVTDGASTTCAEFYGRLARAFGLEAPKTAPRWLLFTALRLVEAWLRLSRGAAPPLVDTVRFLDRPHAYSIEKARRLLGYAPRVSLDEGMAELMAVLTTRQAHELAAAAG